MRKIITFVLIAACFFSYSAKAGERDPSYFDDFYDVAIIDDRLIWIVGSQGTILHSSDRGESWVVQKGGTDNSLSSVWAIDANRLWIAGIYGTVLHTEDGGRRWERISTPTKNHLFAIQFINPQKGWIVGEGSTILDTENGGGKWQDHSLGKDVLLYGMSLLDSQDGYIAGEFGNIYHTRDGGKTWKQQVSGIEQALFSEKSQCLFDIIFRDKDHGYAVGLDGGMLNTDDGGKGWKHTGEVGGKNHLLSMALEGQRIWMVGLRGTIVHRELNSNRWNRIDLGVKQPLNGIAMGKKLGIIVGSNGTVIRTQDGGAHWEILKPGERRAK